MAEMISAALKAYLDDIAARQMVPGVSLAVVKNGQSESYLTGMAQLVPQPEILKPENLYDMASLTKVVATTSLGLMAVAAGYLNLDDPVSKYLPAFPYDDVKIVNLWAHTSGLAADDRNYRQAQNPQQLLDFICRLEKVYPTGTQVLYSDFNFILLGRIIEGFCGPLDKAFAQHLALPLGMKTAGYRPADRHLAALCVPTEDEKDRGGVIKGVVHDGKAFRMNGVSGNASLFSNVSDMIPFVEMMLNRGRYNGQTVIDEKVMALLKNRYTPVNDRKRTLGWYMDDKEAAFGKYCSDDCLFHTGFTGTSIYLDYKRNGGIILFTNRVHPSRSNNNISLIRDTVSDMILKNW